MAESEVKEDDLDTLEKEYNAEYYVDSDGLQRYGEEEKSESEEMSDESETGTDNMSGLKSPEQETDPQAMRGGGEK